MMSSTRYQVSWMKWKHFLGYHHVLMVILSIAIIAMSIVTAGCSSYTVVNIYLISLSYVDCTSPAVANKYPSQVNQNISSTFSTLTDTSFLEVRAGYLGLCTHQTAGKWQCSRSATLLAGLVELSSSNTAKDNDPLNLIWIASNFKDQIVFVGLIFIRIALSLLAILLLSLFPGWHVEEEEDGSEREVKPFPSKAISHLATVVIVFASAFMFVSILWQHIASVAAASMVGSLTYGSAVGHVGATAMALGWVAVFCQFVCSAGMVLMILSVKVLSEMVE